MGFWIGLKTVETMTIPQIPEDLLRTPLNQATAVVLMRPGMIEAQQAEVSHLDQMQIPFHRLPAQNRNRSLNRNQNRVQNLNRNQNLIRSTVAREEVADSLLHPM